MSQKDNYLDYIPEHKPGLIFEVNEAGEVTILKENKGAFNTIAQKLFKKPRISKIHLEGRGNYIWTIIDGKRSILEISELVKEKFGDEAEPLYNRLVTYIRMLEDYGFIVVNHND